MDAKKLMGFETPGDKRVAVPVRDWDAMKRGAWRSRISWEIAVRQALDILMRCEHSEKCPGFESELEPCLSSCPDREIRMSALVILNAARAFAPVDARRPADGQYFAPSREYFSDMVSMLGAQQLERDAMLEVILKAGLKPPLPPENVERRLPKRALVHFDPAEFEYVPEEEAEDDGIDPAAQPALEQENPQ